MIALAIVALSGPVARAEADGSLELIDAVNGSVVLEVLPGKEITKVAIPAGRYRLRVEGEGQDAGAEREIVVKAGETVVVQEQLLVIVGLPSDRGAGATRSEPTAQAEHALLEPRVYESMTSYGGLVFALMGGHTTVRSFDQSDIARRMDAPLWEGALRLGWAFPLLRARLLAHWPRGHRTPGGPHVPLSAAAAAERGANTRRPSRARRIRRHHPWSGGRCARSGALQVSASARTASMTGSRRRCLRIPPTSPVRYHEVSAWMHRSAWARYPV